MRFKEQPRVKSSSTLESRAGNKFESRFGTCPVRTVLAARRDEPFVECKQQRSVGFSN